MHRRLVGLPQTPVYCTRHGKHPGNGHFTLFTLTQGPEQTLPPKETPGFWSKGTTPRTFYDSVVASVWSAGQAASLNKIIKKSSSVLGCPLDSVQEVGAEGSWSNTSMLDLESHNPLQDALSALESSFSVRVQPHCGKEHFHRSFLPATVRLYNQHC